MIKTIVLIKRRTDLTFEAFRDAYEAGHAEFALPYLGRAARYVRRYVQPVRQPMTGEVAELDFDVITEVWYETREDYEATLEAIAAARELFAGDELKIFKTNNNPFFTVDEIDSDLTRIR